MNLIVILAAQVHLVEVIEVFGRVLVAYIVVRLLVHKSAVVVSSCFWLLQICFVPFLDWVFYVREVRRLALVIDHH